MLDPADYQVFRCEVRYRRRHGNFSYRYWPNGKRIELVVPKNYVPFTETIAAHIANATKSSFKTRAVGLGETASFAAKFPVIISKPKATAPPPETPTTILEEQKLSSRAKTIKREIKILETRMKARATRIKRAETAQKKDQKKLNYLTKRQTDVNSAHDLAAAEAELDRQAAEEREAEQYSKPKSQTQGWIDVIKAIGKE